VQNWRSEEGTVPDDHPVGQTLRHDEDGPSSQLERSVERTYALVPTVIGRLLACHPEQAIGAAALEDLQRMRPHLEEALAALARIEEGRDLTEKELSYRRAFRMLY
jgi:hypothetical protein